MAEENLEGAVPVKPPLGPSSAPAEEEPKRKQRARRRVSAHLLGKFDVEAYTVAKEAQERFSKKRWLRIFFREVWYQGFHPWSLPFLYLNEGLLGLELRHFWGATSETPMKHQLTPSMFIYFQAAGSALRWFIIITGAFYWEEVVEKHSLQGDFFLALHASTWATCMVSAKWATRSRFATDRMRFPSSRRDEELLWGWIPLPTSTAVFQLKLAMAREGINGDAPVLMAAPADCNPGNDVDGRRIPCFLQETKRRHPSWARMRKVPEEDVESWDANAGTFVRPDVTPEASPADGGAHGADPESRKGSTKVVPMGLNGVVTARAEITFYEVPLKAILLEQWLVHSMVDLLEPENPQSVPKSQRPKEYTGTHPVILPIALAIICMPGVARVLFQTEPSPPHISDWSVHAIVLHVCTFFLSFLWINALLLPICWVFLIEYRRRIKVLRSFAHILPTRVLWSALGSARVGGLRRPAHDRDASASGGVQMVMTPRNVALWHQGFNVSRRVGEDILRRIGFGLCVITGTYIGMFAYMLVSALVGNRFLFPREPYLVISSFWLAACAGLYGLYIIHYGEQITWMPKGLAMLLRECGRAAVQPRPESDDQRYYPGDKELTREAIDRTVELLESQHELQPLLLAGVVEFKSDTVRGMLLSMATYLGIIINQIDWTAD